MNQATWYKLKTGEWGVKVRHTGQPGDTVNILNKKGEEKTMWLSTRAAKFEDAELWEVTDQETRSPSEEEPF